eukprot:624099-Prorocentrum_minimum.AAC.1
MSLARLLGRSSTASARRDAGIHLRQANVVRYVQYVAHPTIHPTLSRPPQALHHSAGVPRIRRHGGGAIWISAAYTSGTGKEVRILHVLTDEITTPPVAFSSRNIL